MKIDINEIIQRYPRCRKFRQLYEEAQQQGGEIVFDDRYMDIILPNSIDETIFVEAGIPADTVMGLHLRPLDDKVSVFLAIADSNGISPKILLADKFTADESLNTIKLKTILFANSCGICHKDIPTNDQKIYQNLHICPECYANFIKERGQEDQLAGLYGEI